MRRCGYWGAYHPGGAREAGRPGPYLGVVDRWSAPADMRALVGATPTVLGRLDDNSHQDRRRNRCVQDEFAGLYATIEGLTDGRHSMFPRLYRRRRPSGKPEERGQLFVDADACPHFLAGHRFTCRYCPDPQSIAESLVDVFGVETVVGLPRYTYYDWETRSDWCKQLGPDGVSGPHDDLSEYDSWCLSPRRPQLSLGRWPATRLPRSAFGASTTKAGEAVARERNRGAGLLRRRMTR